MTSPQLYALVLLYAPFAWGTRTSSGVLSLRPRLHVSRPMNVIYGQNVDKLFENFDKAMSDPTPCTSKRNLELLMPTEGLQHLSRAGGCKTAECLHAPLQQSAPIEISPLVFVDVSPKVDLFWCMGASRAGPRGSDMEHETVAATCRASPGRG